MMKGKVRRWVGGCLGVVFGVAALSSILWFRFSRQWREATCTNQLYTLGLALALYSHDHDGRLPSDTNQTAELIRYDYGGRLSLDFVSWGPGMFHCPCDRHPKDLQTITNSELDADGSSRCSYDCLLAYPPLPEELTGADALMWDIDGGDPKSPRANHRHGSGSWGNVLYFDGHVRRVPYAKWPEPNRPPRAGDASKMQIGVPTLTGSQPGEGQ